MYDRVLPDFVVPPTKCKDGCAMVKARATRSKSRLPLLTPPPRSSPCHTHYNTHTALSSGPT